MCFHVQISLVNPKNLQCFSCVDRTRRRLVGLKHTFFNGASRLVHSQCLDRAMYRLRLGCNLNGKEVIIRSGES